jgi:hypothetical protein
MSIFISTGPTRIQETYMYIETYLLGGDDAFNGSSGPLHRGDTIPERERDSLGLGTDADVPRQLALATILLAFHRHVHQRILTKH